MPNRILKESICTSDTVDNLTPEAEVFFYRLIVNCDDYGLMDARPRILIAKCYPLRASSMSEAYIQTLLDALVKVGLVVPYQVDNRPYLFLPTWHRHQYIRARKTRYPMPPREILARYPEYVEACQRTKSSDETCKHMQADDSKLYVIQSNPIQSNTSNDNFIDLDENISLTESQNQSANITPAEEKESEPENIPAVDIKENPTDNWLAGVERAMADYDRARKHDGKFDEFWQAYPRREGKSAAREQWRNCMRGGIPPDDLIAAAYNYASFVAKSGRAKEHVLLAKTFLGPEKRFEDFVEKSEPEPSVETTSDSVPWWRLTDEYRQFEESYGS